MSTTPPSLRFLGRKVYYGVAVVLLPLLMEGPIRRLRCPRCCKVRTEAVPWAFVMVAERRNLSAVDQWPQVVWGLLAAGVLIRPDMTLLYGLFLVYGLLSGSASRRNLVCGAGLLAAVWVGLLPLGYFYYGDLLPNTYYLKATGSPRSLMLQSALSQLCDMTGWTGLFFLALGLACLTASVRSSPVALLAFATVLAVFAYNVWIGGDWAPQYHSRFIVPVVSL